jgi:hypothetical protein
MLKSHEFFDPRYRKVIYVVRDPRDVLVSYYFQYRRRNQHKTEVCSMEQYMNAFLSGELDAFGSWQDNVGSWVGARRGAADFLLVRYEDLSADPDRELGRVAGLLGWRSDAERMRQAVVQSSFQQMRELERFQVEVTRTLDPSRREQPFVRSGTVGGWKRELPEALATRIEDAWGATMSELGYLDAPEPRGRASEPGP